jgi:amino acid adenylation domain-containing protein
LDFMLRDAKPACLITTSEAAFDFPDGQRQLVLDQPDTVTALSQNANINPTNQERKRSLAPGNLTYVIYTSGSTGRPKGILSHHRGVVSYLTFLKRAYGLHEGDIVLQLPSFSFDPSVRDIFGSLTSGTRLIIVTNMEAKNPLVLLQKIADCRVTCLLSLVPSLLRRLVESSNGNELCDHALRLILTCGESLYLADYENTQKYFGKDTYVVNQYGPTECTMTSSYYPIVDTRSDRATVSIGRPIENAHLYILAPQLLQVPIGAIGELCITGIGLTRGYLNRPELTAQQFIPNPFSNEPGSRIYKTGDLARFRSDGNLELLGRNDHQVKVRGFRIELAEIEAVLKKHEQLKQAVVIAQDGGDGKHLVAYVVGVEEAIPEIAELRSYVQERLPGYMVPNAFVYLPELPLTPNGKLDRRALPALSGERLSAGYVAPRTAVERILCEIWSQVLHIERVGLHDNFFEVGGHSLAAMVLMARIRESFGQQLPLSILFQSGTVASFAELLDRSPKRAALSPLVAIQPLGVRPPFFCVHPAGGIVYSYFGLARSLGLEQPFYGLEDIGIAQDTRPYTRVEDMAAHYLGEMQTIQPKGPYLIGGWSFGGLVAFEMAQQLNASGHKVALLAIFDTHLQHGNEFEMKADDVEHFVAIFHEHIPGLRDNLNQARFSERLPLAIQLAKESDLLPPDFDIEDVRRLIKVAKANREAAINYRPTTYPGRMTLFRAEDEFKRYGAIAEEWNQLALGGVEVRIVSGTHATMTRTPHVQSLAEHLRAALNQATKGWHRW